MKKVWTDFVQRPLWRKLCDILLVLFALAGVAIIGAWALYQLGITNNRGAVDKNYRYLMTVSEMEAVQQAEPSLQQTHSQWAIQVGRLAALARYYPTNAHLMLKASQHSDDPMIVAQMVAAAQVYLDDHDSLDLLADAVAELLATVPQQQHGNLIPWMAGPEWVALKEAILRDSALINEAGRLTGVEPRLIVGCLVGEQIRLFNSKREMFKRYLGPVKVLSVQSQFSYGVNGIKDFTAEAVEAHLTDPQSEFYMGKTFEHLLDFETDDHATERYNRLVDYRNHLYSYIYTGCILHQTMLQWRRAGHDISHRPDVLFTLFNLGFDLSVPKADPACGGSRITIGDRDYTFGSLGFDFYYSGELAETFPYWHNRFNEGGQPLTAADIARIQSGMSDCDRPEYGHEYRQPAPTTTDSTPDPPDPFGINVEEVTPMEHSIR